MNDNGIEVLSVLSKKENPIKMPLISKQNVGHKRRMSLTPMRPVAIAPKTNFPRCLQSVERAIKNEPGFIAIVPRTNQISSDNDQGGINKPNGKLDQYEIFESFTGLHNSKRIKLGTDDLPMQYIILQNQSLDTCNTILITDTEEKISNQPKSNQQEYTMIKNSVSNNGKMQQYNVVDKSNLSNCSSSAIPHKLNFTNQELIPIAPNSETLNFNSHKNNSMEPSHSSALPNCNINNESRLLISRNGTAINMIEKSDSLNIAVESLENLDSLKSRPQKPVVIMQQQLSPPNRTISPIKTKRVSLSGLNKLLPLNVQSVNIETNIFSEQPSLPKSNENFYDAKGMNHNATRVNNDEQETDFLLKKEFPVISSSQVDSVLKAIDMQELNRGIVLNEVNSNSKKQAGNKDTNDITRSLPCTQGAAKLCKNENTQCENTGTDHTNKMQTNRPAKRFQSERHAENYSKAVEKLVDTLQYYKCKECPYMSLNEKYIFEHIEREHINVSESKGKPILRCPGCSNTFHYEASLFSHIVHDHQVHESEAQIMVQQLFYRQHMALDGDSPKPISQICVTKPRNEQACTTQRPDQIFENNLPVQILPALSLPKITSVSSLQKSEPLVEKIERTQNLSAVPLPKITAVGSLQAGNQPSDYNAIVENSDFQYVQNMNNMPVIVRSSLGAVDVRNAPFLNDDRLFSTKSDVQHDHNQQAKVLEIKTVDCSEKVNLFELKSGGDRNFEFVDLKSVTHNDEGEGYLQEDDPMERGISDSEMEFVDLAVKESASENTRSDTEAVKTKKKGRPKGSKSYATKPQAVSLKQGYKCEVEDCGVRMLVQENIAYHQKCHVVTTTPSNVSFQCPECVEFKSNNWKNLAGHLWRSHIIDMELHCCDLCSYKTPSLSNLANQHRGIHGDDRPFLCDNCDKGFKTRKQLRNHRALHNAKAKEPLKCDVCKRDFTNMRLLKLHKGSVHRESKPFTCSSCSYSAATRSALKLHLRRHTGEKPFSCEQCSYSTGDHNSLRRHKLRHLGLKPYNCPHCSYASIQSSTYKVHLKNKHPGLDHDLMFSCQYCSYKSIKKDNLLTHMAKHEQVLSNKPLAGSGSPILIE